jgi:hypothetical protein
MPDNRQIRIPPNKPVFASLVDPEGSFDFELNVGTYETTTGQMLTLPRPAVVKLNELGPQPGEEIVIQQHWSGRAGDPKRWTVALSTRSGLARAEAENGQDITPQLDVSIRQAEERKAVTAPPTPISTPKKREATKETGQHRLFDRRGEMGTWERNQ